MKIIFAYASNTIDLNDIKNHGFDTIIGNFNDSVMDEMLSLGLKCIVPNIFKEHEAILGYYLFDEPDLWNVSIEEQDRVINEFRALTDKPLFISMIEQLERKCSLNFDYYLLDIYYNTKTLSKLKNYLNVTFSSMFAQILYKGKNVIPIMGIFDDNTFYEFTTEQLPFARKFRSYFKTNDHSIFIWGGDKVTINGIIDRKEYSEWAKLLNTTTDKCWNITYAVLYAISWCFLKITRKV